MYNLRADHLTKQFLPSLSHNQPTCRWSPPQARMKRLIMAASHCAESASDSWDRSCSTSSSLILSLLLSRTSVCRLSSPSASGKASRPSSLLPGIGAMGAQRPHPGLTTLVGSLPIQSTTTPPVVPQQHCVIQDARGCLTLTTRYSRSEGTWRTQSAMHLRRQKVYLDNVQIIDICSRALSNSSWKRHCRIFTDNLISPGGSRNMGHIAMLFVPHYQGGSCSWSAHLGHAGAPQYC